MILKATSRLELLDELGQIDCRVPEHRKDRTNDQIERWIFAHLLSTLASNNALEYPVFVSKRERPDYILSQNRVKTGFEITEAVNPQLLQAQTLPEASQGSGIDLGQFKWGKKHSLARLRQIASSPTLIGAPWMGDQADREYVALVKDVAQKKTVTLNKPGFDRFESNLSLIHI